MPYGPKPKTHTHTQTQSTHSFQQAVLRCWVSRKSSEEAPGEDDSGWSQMTPLSWADGYLHRVDPTAFGSLQKLGWFPVEY